MNWFEADKGFLINLDLVKAVEANKDNTSTIYFDLGNKVDSVSCEMPYESIKSIFKSRQESVQRNLKTIAYGSFTPVP